MSREIDELIQFVEANPEDFKQRWRLAKKLYNAWDYRSALQHLQILREEWPDRLSIIRYLSATYYRLGRYEDATRELVAVLEFYPQEVSVLELLARVYEGAGNRKKALETWRKVLTLTSNSDAEAAIDRLEDSPGGATSTDASVFESSTESLSSHSNDTLVVCKFCGTVNELFGQRCPRCHASFIEMAGEAPVVAGKAKPVLANNTVLVFGLSAVATGGLCFWAFLALQ